MSTTPWIFEGEDDPLEYLEHDGNCGCCCHHGVGFDEECEWCDEEYDEDVQ